MKLEFPKKSVVADRPTIGSQVYDVLNKHAGKRSDVEAGDMGRELGKKYIEEINELIQKNGEQKNPYYIFVIRKKAKWTNNAVALHMQSRWTKPQPEPDTDCWKISPGHAELQWSLPGDAEMDMIMKIGQDFDQKLVNWILEYRTGKLQ